MRALFLLLLAAAPARALDDYKVTLRLENGKEERRVDLPVAPGGYNNAVFRSSSGARVETQIVNLMAVQTPLPRRVDLSYQIEWSLIENGMTRFVLQASDWSRIPEEREVLLLSFDEDWRLWATVETGVDHSCEVPPKGGGLRAAVRFEKEGVRHAFERRSSDGATSAIVVATGGNGLFDFMLTPRLGKDGSDAEAEYRYALKDGGADDPFTTKSVRLGKETALEDGVFLTLAKVPVEDAAGAGALAARDPDTGWYLYDGNPLSFRYPPEWTLRTSCDGDRRVNGWNLVNRGETENPLHAAHIWGMRRESGDDPGSASGDVESLSVKGGECAVSRDEVSDPLCRENCAPSLIARASCRPSKEGGSRIDFHFDLGREAGLDTERYARFLRFVKSFELKD